MRSTPLIGRSNINRPVTADGPVVWFENLRKDDVPGSGARTPRWARWFTRSATRACAFRRASPRPRTYRRYVERNGLQHGIAAALSDLAAGRVTLAEAGEAIRRSFLRGEWPPETAAAITSAYRELCRRIGRPDAEVAVRSSATAEDLPDASFAGQQETFLNVRGRGRAARRRAGAATPRCSPIAPSAYRQAKGFDHLKVALSVGVQSMVRSDLGGAGVMFSIDTETGFDKVVLINAAWGLGENVVQGAVDPDEYEVFKPLAGAIRRCRRSSRRSAAARSAKMVYASGADATDQATFRRRRPSAQPSCSRDPDILTSARWACIIEEHYGRPMDMEWAKDGESGEMFIVQARPETVQSRREAGAFKTYRVTSEGPETGDRASASATPSCAGSVCLIESPNEIDRFVDGAVLVTRDDRSRLGADHEARRGDRHRPWRPHVSRGDRQPRARPAGGRRDRQRDTRILHDEQDGDGLLCRRRRGLRLRGTADIETKTLDLGRTCRRPAPRSCSISPIPRRRSAGGACPPTASAWRAWSSWSATTSGSIRWRWCAIDDAARTRTPKRAIAELTAGYDDKTEYFVDRLARGLARIAAALSSEARSSCG